MINEKHLYELKNHLAFEFELIGPPQWRMHSHKFRKIEALQKIGQSFFITKETAKEINRRVVLPIVYVQHCQENLKFLLELLANFLTFPAPYIMQQQQHRMCISCLRRLFVHYSLCCFAR